MDHLSREIYFKGQKIAATKASSNIPSGLNYDALMALPFIGIRVGIDEMTPTKAVYAMYDSELDSLRFVHGNGSLIMSDQVCFLKEFKNGTSNNAQRLYSTELKKRSTEYFQKITSGSPEEAQYYAEARNKFPTKSSVTASLTFVSDLNLDSCPALTTLPPEYLAQLDDSENNGTSPLISLVHSPKYDFNPSGFQGRICRAQEYQLGLLHVEFTHAYQSSISFLDFQHAAFCLKGLKQAELVHFLQEGQNDPRYIVDGQTPPLPPRLCIPLQTTTGWTVDCFLARFRFYEKVYNEGEYQRLPNPVAWLEAELEEEERNKERDRDGVMRPWKGIVDGEKCRAVVDWDVLAGLELGAGGKKYPELLSFQVSQSLEVGDVINPHTFKFKESKRAKRERREKERVKAKARATNVEVVDLTGGDDDGLDSMIVGHMNRPYTQLPVRTPPNATFSGNRNASSGFTPINSKRKHDDRESHSRNAVPSIFGPKLHTQNYDFDTDTAPADDDDAEDMDAAIKRASMDYNSRIYQQSEQLKKEPSQTLFDDIYSSDREPSQLYTNPQKKRLCRRNGSPVSKPLDMGYQSDRAANEDMKSDFKGKIAIQRNARPSTKLFLADPFLDQDIKMEEEEPISPLFQSRADSLFADQDFFATAHEADSESDDEIITSNSGPHSPGPYQRSPHHTSGQSSSMLSTPCPRYKPFSNSPRIPHTPQAIKFEEACDAFEESHKSPPNTPVSKSRLQFPSIKEEESSMRVQSPFGIKSEVEAEGFVNISDGPGLPLEHPGGAEVKMEGYAEGSGSWLGAFLGR